MYGTTKSEAQAFADYRNSLIHGHGLTATDHGERPTTSYIVDSYPGTKLWGVTRRWTYADRPDLGEFGGGFVVVGSEPV